ncbi:MAG TPA: glycerol-3-phosphate 1-O-acyltransferase [Myxococcota bacterium]|nr:glycerol-3-phosphate 1-O-acyltransferase [Myxococcota bacterium]
MVDSLVMASALHGPLRDEPGWPAIGVGAPSRVIFLCDSSSRVEQRLLEAWVARHRPEGADCECVAIPPSRRRRETSQRPLEARIAAADHDVVLAPLRVAWLPRKRDGVRAARFSDLLKLGDPRDPSWLRQHGILRRERDRCRIVAGEPAPLSELRARWQAASSAGAESASLADYVSRQAALALERAERRLRGARYKVPRLVHEDILGRPAFRGGLALLAREQQRASGSVAREAARDLREIAATHSTFVIDLAAQLIRLMYTRGYGESLHYDREKLARIQSLAQRHPVVLLPTHKSNLDHLVLQYMLYENGHPPNHTAGGINMNFFPVGPLVRRSGVFFIRRSFKDDAVYKFVLRHYIDYLVEKRFSLEWYIEGGRSRSGKLLPPRFGLLAYVVDAYRRGKSDDVVLIPVSIAYDQISDVPDYAAEQSGAAKQRESFGWFLRFLRRLGRRYGEIHISFGEPLSLAKALGPPDPQASPDPDEQSLALQKLAFEVCLRINQVTPITPISLVALAVLGAADRAQTVEDVRARLANLLYDVARRQLPVTHSTELETREGVERVLEALVENGVVTRFDEGSERVYRIGPDQQLAAAYYRNTIIHFFVNPAIGELALLRAAEAGGADAAGEFFRAAMQLRDLLKFEFFFADKEIFRGELRRELAERDPHWEDALRGGPDPIQGLVRRFRPFNAHRVLRPFFEAYRVVADLLARQDPGAPLDRTRFLAACMGVGRQYHLQGRLHSTASISRVLFENALRLAENRALLEPAEPELARWRGAFADEIRGWLRRIDAIDALAASRRAGLIP